MRNILISENALISYTDFPTPEHISQELYINKCRLYKKRFAVAVVQRFPAKAHPSLQAKLTAVAKIRKLPTSLQIKTYD